MEEQGKAGKNGERKKVDSRRVREEEASQRGTRSEGEEVSKERTRGRRKSIL